jgi:hypothetical protein
MSFGYGIGDIIAVGNLAWELYYDFFLVARGAPQEFRLLVDELKTLHATMKLLRKSPRIAIRCWYALEKEGCARSNRCWSKSNKT